MIKNHAIAVLQELKVGIVSTHARYPSCFTVNPWRSNRLCDLSAKSPHLEPLAISNANSFLFKYFSISVYCNIDTSKTLTLTAVTFLFDVISAGVGIVIFYRISRTSVFETAFAFYCVFKLRVFRCWTFIFYPIFSGQGRLDLQRHGRLVGRKVPTGSGKVI